MNINELYLIDDWDDREEEQYPKLQRMKKNG